MERGCKYCIHYKACSRMRQEPLNEICELFENRKNFYYLTRPDRVQVEKISTKEAHRFEIRINPFSEYTLLCISEKEADDFIEFIKDGYLNRILGGIA